MDATVSAPATLTLTAAAEYLGVSRAVFYRDVAPTAPFIRTLTGHRRYRPADLDAWLEEHLEAPRES